VSEARGQRPRVAILHQGFVPDYRVEFFTRLGRVEEVGYVVFHGAPRSGSGHRAAPGPFPFANVPLANREVRIGGKTLLYQPAIRAVAGPEFDAAVLGAELGLPANVALFPLLKLRRRPVLLWGQGGDKDEDRGALLGVAAGLGSRLKAAAARSANGYIAYTAGGRERLLAGGADPDRVFVVRNTLDVEGEIKLHLEAAEIPEQRLREELGLRPDSVVLLFVGRVYAEKRLDELVSLLRELRRRGLDENAVEAVALGDGPDLERVRREAVGLAGLRFAGEVRDRETVARYMRVAAALVIPGKVGLAVNHALAHGVPILTRESTLHAPEFEYLSPDNSVVVAGGFEQFAAEVAAFVASPERRERLAAGALAARQSLTLSAMVDAFDGAVRAVLDVQN
jgi:glycosyltransferase involved in cell wall biosynthesis